VGGGGKGAPTSSGRGKKVSMICKRKSLFLNVPEEGRAFLERRKISKEKRRRLTSFTGGGGGGGMLHLISASGRRGLEATSQEGNIKRLDQKERNVAGKKRAARRHGGCE